MRGVGEGLASGWEGFGGNTATGVCRQVKGIEEGEDRAFCWQNMMHKRLALQSADDSLDDE
jgi:hypothetical protein